MLSVSIQNSDLTNGLLLATMSCMFFYSRIGLECIKDQKKFTSDELEAITSHNYGRRKRLSDVDVITIQDLYSTGEVMALHEQGIIII